MLPTYEAPTVQINLHNGEAFRVRGLTFDDLCELAARHLDKLDAFMRAVGEDASDDQHIADALRHIVTDAPEVAAHIVALAADDPDGIEKALALPFGTQFEALSAALRLTFEEAGGFAPFVAAVAPLLKVRPRATVPE